MEKENQVEEQERPCELLVIEIVDKDLLDTCLQDSILAAINDTELAGKCCSEQLRLLSETPKPFVLTFTGRNFKKTNSPFKNRSGKGYFTILKELVAYDEGEEKRSFNAMVK